ncbi:MAG TPA: glycosyl hydrolase family 28-related protein [Candidatus Brocadiia bacterium]|nr:glycosyl hydrolase family 28-related protein [Candidatus Brocadiia bacterium]
MRLQTGLLVSMCAVLFSCAEAQQAQPPDKPAQANNAGAATLQPAPKPANLLELNVMDFGAVGDGKTDDTAAFQKALDEAGKPAAGTVKVPNGNFLIKTHLVIPANVTLEGVWRIPTAWTQNKGSTLLAVEGQGKEDGPPFIMLNPNSVVKGLTIFYPDQKAEAIKAYPPCVAGAGGDNCSIVDCLLVNPYYAVDFGTRPSGRHYIRNLYGQPLKRGIFIDKCYDVGRIENVHFWPFWQWDEKSGIQKWIWDNGEAFVFARTDWEYVCNTFVFGYKIGYRFIESKDGACNGNFLGIGSDASGNAVVVDQCWPYGLLITNGEFVAFAGKDPVSIVVGPNNKGTMQLQNCAFWGPSQQIARIEGRGNVTFQNCNFMDYDCAKTGRPALELLGGNLIVSASQFNRIAPQLVCGPEAGSAIMTGNRFSGPQDIRWPSGVDVQVGFNVVNSVARQTARRMKHPQDMDAIVVTTRSKDGFETTGEWTRTTAGEDYIDDSLFALKGDGNCSATFRPELPKAGKYAVYIWFGLDPNNDHAPNGPVTVIHADGESKHTVKLKEDHGMWVKLGEFNFPAGRKGAVVVTNCPEGNVLADAVKFVAVGK